MKTANSQHDPNYTELLPALRRAVAGAMSDAAWRLTAPLEPEESLEDRMGDIFADLWVELTHALFAHRDVHGHELAYLIATIAKEEADIELVPVVGTIHGAIGDDLMVTWDNAYQPPTMP